jgi:hypothetical protein
MMRGQGQRAERVKTASRARTAPERPDRQLEAFIAKFTPEVRALAKAVLRRMRKRLPGAVQLVYDNYNALAVGFGPTERASDAIFSIAVFPRWVSLFFLQGAKLPDPQKRLAGAGNKVRHIVLESASTLDEPAVRELMRRALRAAAVPLAATGQSRILIKSVSARQRPRRPDPDRS